MRETSHTEPFTACAKTAIAGAAHAAGQCGNDRISAGHLLLGVLSAPGWPGDALLGLGVLPAAAVSRLQATGGEQGQLVAGPDMFSPCAQAGLRAARADAGLLAAPADAALLTRCLLAQAAPSVRAVLGPRVTALEALAAVEERTAVAVWGATAA